MDYVTYSLRAHCSVAEVMLVFVKYSGNVLLNNAITGQ